MVRIQVAVCFIIFSVIAQAVFCSFPNVEKYEGVFMGEGINCGGTSANVVPSSQTVRMSDEAIVSVVGNAIVEGVSDVVSYPEEWAVISAAEESSRKVLEVVSEAMAEVSAEINSPNPGCWAIGYGRAEAEAIAEVTVTAIATAFAKAGEDAQVRVDTSTVENDLQTEIKEVVLMLRDGRGLGFQSESQEVIASVKAQAVNCALAQAFASIVGDPQAIVFTYTGCQQIGGLRILPDFTGCECIQKNSFGAPNLCGLFGDSENGDYICYTSQECDCSQESLRYPQLKWRYCGPTQDTMMKWLDVEDTKNNINTQDAGYGYCPNDKANDVLAPPPAAPPPTPTPVPTPSPTPAPPPTPTLLLNVPLNIRVYPGGMSDKRLSLDSQKFVSYVALITDWWQKRPTDIRVYEVANGGKGMMITQKSFPDYDSMICGVNYDEKCKYPERRDARLLVPVNRELTEVVVEMEGLLSIPNKFAMLKSLQLIGY